MRQLAALVLFTALAAGVTPAFSQEFMPSVTGFTIQAYGGLRVPDNLQFDGTAQDLGVGTTFGASAGVDLGGGLSTDIDYMRSSTTYSGLGTSLDSQSLMLDAQYAPSLNLGLQPYVGGGLGIVGVSYKNSDSAIAPAFQVKLGVSGPITGQLSWFGEYRYQQAFGQLNVGTPADSVEYASHSIVGGLKFSFGGGSPSYSGNNGGY